MSRFGKLAGTCLALMFCGTAMAEQVFRHGEFEVHYVVLPTTFLKPSISHDYAIGRARNLAMVNISLIDKTGSPVKCEVKGQAINLLGQTKNLNFRTVTEDKAIYHIAELRHDNEEMMRFKLEISGEFRKIIAVEFEQKLYWEEEYANRHRKQ